MTLALTYLPGHGEEEDGEEHVCCLVLLGGKDRIEMKSINQSITHTSILFFFFMYLFRTFSHITCDAHIITYLLNHAEIIGEIKEMLCMPANVMQIGTL